MNTGLATVRANTILERWDPKVGSLHSEDIYNGLTALGQVIRVGEMDEILSTFQRAGLIYGAGFVDGAGIKQHGAMKITSVNVPLLKQLEFD